MWKRLTAFCLEAKHTMYKLRWRNQCRVRLGPPPLTFHLCVSRLCWCLRSMHEDALGRWYQHERIWHKTRIIVIICQRVAWEHISCYSLKSEYSQNDMHGYVCVFHGSGSKWTNYNRIQHRRKGFHCDNPKFPGKLYRSLQNISRMHLNPSGTGYWNINYEAQTLEIVWLLLDRQMHGRTPFHRILYTYHFSSVFMCVCVYVYT
jgi:hypothetical protein